MLILRPVILISEKAMCPEVVNLKRTALPHLQVASKASLSAAETSPTPFSPVPTSTEDQLQYEPAQVQPSSQHVQVALGVPALSKYHITCWTQCNPFKFTLNQLLLPLSVYDLVLISPSIARQAPYKSSLLSLVVDCSAFDSSISHFSVPEIRNFRHVSYNSSFLFAQKI